MKALIIIGILLVIIAVTAFVVGIIMFTGAADELYRDWTIWIRRGNIANGRSSRTQRKPSARSGNCVLCRICDFIRNKLRMDFTFRALE